MNIEKLINLEIEYTDAKALLKLFEKSKNPRLIIDIENEEGVGDFCESCQEVHEYEDNPVTIQDQTLTENLKPILIDYLERRCRDIEQVFSMHGLSFSDRHEKRKSHLRLVTQGEEE